MEDASCNTILNLPDPLLRQCLEFVGPNCYRFVAGTCRAFRATYNEILQERRAKRTTNCKSIFASSNCYRIFEVECKSDGHHNYLLETQPDLFTTRNNQLSIKAGEHAKQAAKFGDVECLKYICEDLGDRHVCDSDCEKEYEWRPCFERCRSFQIAGISAQYGHLECLQYAIEQRNCRTNSELAARGGHLACLRYLFQKFGGPRSLPAIAAVDGDSSGCLQFVHENGGDVSECAYWAAEHGSLNCLQYLLEAGLPIAPGCARAAAKNEHIECLEYLNENGIHESDVMDINVKTLTGKQVPFHLDSSDTVLKLKKMIKVHEGLPVDQQRLIFCQRLRRGQKLADDDTLSHYGIRSGDTLHLVIRLCGGSS